ncbi:MAG: SMC family ATPase [Acidobacteria bacterium]|nr:SMC family ATPase [Acidobacteriota bacterium]
MQITRVELKNIKNHTEAEFIFQPGVIAICGPNGSGKTTILEAIAWALFDHLDYKRDDFIKRGMKKGQVAVAFISNLDEREYVVTRDTGGSYSVYDPATKIRIAEQKNQVVPWLHNHIGVEPGTDLGALFKTTIGVPQGTFTHDFTLAPANRKGVFDQILKVDEYRNASDNLRETLRHIETRMIEFDKLLAQAQGELKKYEETKREHDIVERELQSLEADQKVAASERERSSRLAEELGELQRKIETLRGTIERLQVKLELTQGSLATAHEAAEQARTAAEIVERSRQRHDAYLAAGAALAELSRKRDYREGLRSQVAVIERQLIEANSRVLRSEERLTEAAGARQELAGLSQKVAAQEGLERQISSLQEERRELQNLQRMLQTLDQELEKLRRRYTDLSRQCEMADPFREKARQVDLFEKDRARIDLEINSKEIALNNFKLKQNHLETLRKDHARLQTELGRIQHEIVRLTALAPIAALLVEKEAGQQLQTEKLAHLRAEVARDEEMITALDHGGICPLLSERCLNLKQGESIEGHFRSGLASRKSEIETIQALLVNLVAEVRRARVAAAETAGLPHFEKESARLVLEIETQQHEVSRLEEDTSTGAKVGEFEIERLKKEKSELQLQLREALEAARMISQAEVMQGEIEVLVKEGEEKKRQRHELIDRCASLSDTQSRLTIAEKELEDLGDPRTAALLLNQIVSRENEWKSEAEKEELKLREFKQSLEQLNHELEPYASLDADIAVNNHTRATNERDYQAYIANQKIAETLISREQDVRALSAEIEETSKLLQAAAQELGKFEKRYDPHEHRRALTECEQWRERATQLATQLTHRQEDFSRLQAQLSYLNEVRVRAQEHCLEKEKAERLCEATEFIREILQKAAPYITESYLFSISNEANQLFREITGRYDVTLRWTKDYEITVEEEGRERPFLNLSGGEQMAAALAVRLALLKELSEINLAFFDEPTTNMDDERRRNLAQQIGRIKDFQQLFVISHDDSFEGYTDQIITLG